MENGKWTMENLRYNYMMKKLLFVLPILLLILFPTYLYFTYPNTNVLKSTGYFMNKVIHPHVKLGKHVMGFLPYWRVEDMKYIRPELLSEINYFGLTVDSDGKLLQVTGNESDPGWREWNTQSMQDFVTKTKINGTEFSVTIISQNNDVIENVLITPSAQITLISQIVNLTKQNHLNGINIDFEYLGDADEEYKNKFTAFTKQLHEAMQKESPKTKLSLSIMPRAARAQDLFDFPRITPYFDRFIGMSYDYYGTSADVSGPGAPMKGFKDGKYFFDIKTTYEDYLKVIPKEKIIMGVPYYGWDRAVTDGKTIMSTTLSQSDPNSYAAVTSYGRLRDEVDFKPNKCTWDNDAQSSWCQYTKDGIDHQVWIEDEKSIGIKYDFAKKQDLGGIGIWVLGYDKNYSDLWNLIREKFGK
jgi:spore germination protein YaaH